MGRGLLTASLLSTWVLAGCGGMTSGASDDSGSGGDGGPGGTPGAGGEVVGGGGGDAAVGGTLASGGLGAGGIPLDVPTIWVEPEPSWDALQYWSTTGPGDDGRPERPASYEPPIGGEPGWRESSVPLCSSIKNASIQLWADENGVALLSQAESCAVLDVGDPCAPRGTELWYNDGLGWKWLWGLRIDAGLELSGLVGGPLLLGGPGVLPIGRDGNAQAGWLESEGSVHGLFGHGPEAYALMGSLQGEELLYEYDGSSWSYSAWLGHVVPSQMGQVTEIDHVAYVHGMGALYRAAGDGVFEEVPGVPARECFGVTGTSAEDLWLAQPGELLHYDGEAWTTEGAYAGAFRDFLEVDGEIYFISDRQFGRATQGGVEILVELEGPTFEALAAASSSEIFVAVTDPLLEEFSCGNQQVLVYDGEQFREF